ncbi:MAG: LCP family protein [Vulcanococcus sp.]|uniref:LCP family protein n=1 Tax=Vulcanococcus sp. TaxID=2856995 RepID=UPI0025E017DD|nr:LCP family protein [Vulcanococcus sp.]MBW0167331.1 LCP family protein [Vulcanococcus sp.]
MSQAQPNPAPRRRPSRGRLKPVEKQERPGRRGATAARQATVTPMEPRRRTKTAKRGVPRLPLFLAGIGLGYGLNGPLPHLAMGLLAGLHHPSNVLGSLVTPAGMGDRRIVVMGTDHVSTNTDVMFTVQLRDGRTELTQVPRDTFIESDRYGVMKANALYSSGGPEMVKQELSKLLSAKVDRYLVLNLKAVQRLADALGGVEVDVPKRMYYVDNSQGLYIDLYPGRQLLKGEALEGFLRFRHDELGDIGRMERQKLVLKEVFKKLANPAMATRLPELMTIAGKDVLTDLSPVDMGALVTAMATTKLSSSRLEGTPYWHEDISYWLPDANPQRDLYRSQEQPPL